MKSVVLAGDGMKHLDGHTLIARVDGIVVTGFRLVLHIPDPDDLLQVNIKV